MKRLKKHGYQAYETDDEEKKTIHSRIGEKKYGFEKIPPNFVIHHIDGNKDNNQYYNLILLHKKDHKRIHLTKSLIIKSVKPSEEESASDIEVEEIAEKNYYCIDCNREIKQRGRCLSCNMEAKRKRDAQDKRKELHGW